MTSHAIEGRLDEGCHVSRLSWPALARRAGGAVGLLPVGAACKEHGRHLPLGSDAVQACWIAERVAAQREALLWPVVHYGHYPAFVDYPGSPSLDADAFAHTLTRALDAMHRAGHRLLIVINTGISTIPAVIDACAAQPGAVSFQAYAGEQFRAAVSRLSRQSGGGHADEVETSLMLHIAPALVDLSRADDASFTTFGPGPLNLHDATAPNYSPSGAMGNPGLADGETGRVLAAALIADALSLIDRHFHSSTD